jgi:S-adenosylmethionine:tRNA ribosyltransferase-isomerase
MSVEFELPDELAASEPPEQRGLRRDGVRLLVAGPGPLTQARFSELAQFVQPGDLIVVNTSATIAAAVDGIRPDGRAVTVHFSTEQDDGSWVVELRPPGRATGPVTDVHAGETVMLPVGVRLVLLEAVTARLWRAGLAVEGGVLAYLSRQGRPISYAYLSGSWPLAYYQSVFARDPGSAEMPSAGRPFSAELVTELVSGGVTFAPITLHTGVSSPETGEPPQPERFTVPVATARLVNHTHRYGGRVIAVGTTVTRALETVATADGSAEAGHGWTELVLGPSHPARIVDGLITGWHAPGATHLHLLTAVAGDDAVRRAYQVAIQERYRWHEFGDSCLLLADRGQRLSIAQRVE